MLALSLSCSMVECKIVVMCFMAEQVIRVKKLVGLPPPALELLASYSVNQRILCVHINEITSIISILL